MIDKEINNKVNYDIGICENQQQIQGRMEQFFNDTEERQNLTYQLMGIMGIQDIDLAYYALKEANWNLEVCYVVSQSVVTNLMDANNNPAPIDHPLPPYVHQPSTGEDDDFPNYDDNNYGDEYNNLPTIEQKKQTFDEMFPSLGFQKQSSLVQHNKLKKLFDKVDEHKLNKFISKLQSNQDFSLQLHKNNRAFKNNKNFILFLNQNYNTKIRFSFGSFTSNLAYSFLVKKPLLVYVHTSNNRINGVLEALLQDSDISDFINKNFVVYGMFDNSNDYEVISKSLPITSLPGIACYYYDEKKNQNVFLGGDKLIQTNPDKIIDSLRIVIAKTKVLYNLTEEQPSSKSKEVQKPAKKAQQHKKPNYSIIDQQNQIYKQMQLQYKLKRQQSKLNKQQKICKQQKLSKMRQQFAQQQQQSKSNLKPNLQTIQIIFRLPISGTLKYKFDSNDKKLYEYVECFASDKFQNEFGEFDLIQTYPPLNLSEKREMAIKEVFEDSRHENLIVKEK